MFNPGLSDAVNILSFRPEESNLESFDVTKLLQKLNQLRKVCKTGSILAWVLPVIFLEPTTLCVVIDNAPV